MGYYFGHSPRELARLEAQSTVLRPITRRLLETARIREGDVVLDLGCGAGDVSLLAAELVGPTGAVVGVDRSAAAVGLARDRARRAGFKNLEFQVAPAEELDVRGEFDMVVGRYVLMHQEHPAAFLRTVSSYVKQGGILALHEIDMRTTFGILPNVVNYQTICDEFMQAIAAGTPHPDTAAKLASIFQHAGLPEPTVFCERPVGTAETVELHRWVASVLLAVREVEGRPPDGDGIDRWQRRLSGWIGTSNSQVVGPDQYCCWVRLGPSRQQPTRIKVLHADDAR